MTTSSLLSVTFHVQDCFTSSPRNSEYLVQFGVWDRASRCPGGGLSSIDLFLLYGTCCLIVFSLSGSTSYPNCHAYRRRLATGCTTAGQARAFMALARWHLQFRDRPHLLLSPSYPIPLRPSRYPYEMIIGARNGIAMVRVGWLHHRCLSSQSQSTRTCQIAGTDSQWRHGPRAHAWNLSDPGCRDCLP
ncbi:hypothetical protein PYCCODRAFT_776996 [Trametes coccinea BRFM310]|uniref:Uncharacterized protein n=1 Tax=Trametes coccinea (strain BRFM310) TaxID=1353009 RepID=A0A1Y2J0H5_TRAC3|nr:hypothetical protein PYCCODRAFT_776996 [Trametes coccinea BRFM310]